VDHHPSDDQPTPLFSRNFFPSGSFLGGNTPLVQAHTTLDKALDERWDSYGSIMADYRAWLRQLPAQVTEEIAFRNGERLFRRSWRRPFRVRDGRGRRTLTPHRSPAWPIRLAVKTVARLPVPLTMSRCATNCAPVIMVFCSGSYFFSKTIQWFTRSVWSHVGIIYRDDNLQRIFVLESETVIGVRLCAAFEVSSRLSRPQQTVQGTHHHRPHRPDAGPREAQEGDQLRHG
jgi:hypothetical protein